MPVVVGVTDEVLKTLLDLADDPRHDVRATMDYGGFSVVIPEYLYERFTQYRSLKSSPPKEPKKSGSKK